MSSKIATRGLNSRVKVPSVTWFNRGLASTLLLSEYFVRQATTIHSFCFSYRIGYSLYTADQLVWPSLWIDIPRMTSRARLTGHALLLPLMARRTLLAARAALPGRTITSQPTLTVVICITSPHLNMALPHRLLMLLTTSSQL